MTSLMIGIAYNLVANQVYALPAKAVLVGSNNPIEVSQDGLSFNPVTLTNQSAALASMFIRATGAGTIVSLKELGASVTTPGGGGATLPTAPLNQVLISQGAGVPPIFSATPKVTRIDAGLASLQATEIGLGGVPVMMRDPTNGTLILSGSTTSNADSMIVVREKPLASFYSPSWIGTLGNISDSTVNTPGQIIAGGGTFHVLGRWNGTNWICVI